MTKFFLDTEFSEDGDTLTLMSIGCVSLEGACFYEVVELPPDTAIEPWVKENVVPNLTVTADGLQREYSLHGTGRLDMERVNVGAPSPIDTVRARFLEYVWDNTKSGGKPEFFGSYCAYDWVAVCRMFGRMVDLPTGFPMFMTDLVALGRLFAPGYVFEGAPGHNALFDALQLRRDFWNVAGAPALRSRLLIG